MTKKPTIHELEEILGDNEGGTVEILPDGSVVVDKELTDCRADLTALAEAAELFHEAVALGPVDAAAKYGPGFDIEQNLRHTGAILGHILARPSVQAARKRRTADEDQTAPAQTPAHPQRSEVSDHG